MLHIFEQNNNENSDASERRLFQERNASVTNIFTNWNFSLNDEIKNFEKKIKYNYPDRSLEIHEYFTRLLIIKDIQSRRSKGEKIISLIDPDEMDKRKISEEDIVLKATDQELETYGKMCVLDSKDIFEEEEITNGFFCKACEHYSGIQKQAQLRSGDEGTGIIQTCSRKTCKKVIVISRG